MHCPALAAAAARGLKRTNTTTRFAAPLEQVNDHHVQTRVTWHDRQKSHRRASKSFQSAYGESTVKRANNALVQMKRYKRKFVLQHCTRRPTTCTRPDVETRSINISDKTLHIPAVVSLDASPTNSSLPSSAPAFLPTLTSLLRCTRNGSLSIPTFGNPSVPVNCP